MAHSFASVPHAAKTGKDARRGYALPPRCEACAAIRAALKAVVLKVRP